MKSLRHNTVYNSRIPDMLVLTRSICAVFLFIAAIHATASAEGVDWTHAEEQLAVKIVGVMGPGAAALKFDNRSSINRADFDNIRRGLTTELAALGVRFVNPEQAAAVVQVS